MNLKINKLFLWILVIFVWMGVFYLGFNLLIHKDGTLSKREGMILVEIARKTIDGEKYDGTIPPGLKMNRPVFVSVYQDGERVSCLGYTYTTMPLYMSVEMLSEGHKIDRTVDYEVVVTVFREYETIGSKEEIVPGKGLLVEQDGRVGVVLPLTFEEQNLTSEKALKLAVLKGDIPDFSWEKAEVKVFDAEVFRG